jgi:hypothetical protein
VTHPIDGSAASFDSQTPEITRSRDYAAPDRNEGECMTARDFELLEEAEAAELLCSRFRTLVDAGYDCTHALVLAVYPQFELDDAEELLAGGSSATAARLLIQRAA